MAIDAGIYQAITPRLKTVADFDREAQAMEAAQQQQAMRGLEMQAAQQRLSDMDRQRQRGSQLRDLLGQGAGPEQLRRAGFLEEARDEEKFGMERQRSGLDIQARQISLLRDSNKMVAERFRNLLSNPQGSTPQQAIQTIAEMRRMGVFAPVAQMQGVSEDDIAASMVREIPPEPGAFASWLRTNAMQALDFDKTLPQVERVDAGGEIITRLRDPISGQVIREERAPKTMAPGEQQRLDLERQRIAQGWASQNKPQFDASTGMVFDPRTRTVTPATGPDGQPIRQPGTRKLDATDRKELFEVTDAINSSRPVLGLISQAKEFSDKAMTGPLAGVRSKVSTTISGALGAQPSEAALATQQLDAIIKEQVLPQMKAIFGGNPTEGERAIMLDMGASSDKPVAVRRALLERAEAAIQARIAANEAKANSILTGNYGGMTRPGAPAQPPLPAAQGRDIGGGFRLKE